MILLFVLSFVMPEFAFMRISSAIHSSGYFGLGILYFIHKGKIDSFLLRYRYEICLLSFVLSASLIPVELVAAFVGVLFSLILSLIVENYCGDRIVRLSDYTYIVFLLSYFPQMFVRGPIAHALPEVNQYTLSFVSCVLGFTFPLLLGMAYKKVRDKNYFTRLGALLIGL